MLGVSEVNSVVNLSMSDRRWAQIKCASMKGQSLSLVVSPKATGISTELLRQARSTGRDVCRCNTSVGEYSKY